jgi:hypothetical protein
MKNLNNIRCGCVSILGLVLLACVALAGVSYWSNQNLPQPPDDLTRLSGPDQARLAESLHLKETFGEQLWPGFGKMDLPVIIWNESYAFLVNADKAPAGWEAVPGETLAGQPYFRQPANNPQNFAMRVGDQWAGSMSTKWQMDAEMQGVFRDALPPVLEDLFPYRVILFPSEVQISAVLHELFHAYQSTVVPERLAAAEAAHRNGDAYWASGMDNADEWREEIRLLSQAVRAKSDEEARQLAREFLAARRERRQKYTLDRTLIDYERQLEWEEGVAKYIELAAWRNAWRSLDTYQPIPAVLSDPDFKNYRSFENRWGQESGITMNNSASQTGETRFYYTGMAQAFLLDRFLPEWKQNFLVEEHWLEDLLAAAVER